MKLRIFLILATVHFTACGDSHREAESRDSHHACSVKSEAKHVGHKTEHAFRKAGGHLEKFFTGHDTISR